MEFFAKNIIPGEVLVQLIAFLIVFFSLKAFAWKPLQASLASRREKIRSDLQEIEEAKREIERLRQEYGEHLQKIEDEARAKLQQAVHEGREIARQIQDKAREESQAAFAKAKENLDLEVAKARITLRREIGDLALRVSEKVIRERLDANREQDKVLEILDQLENTL
ncbi:MAG: F0F1 ATP synthase subunit B [Candidatus Omnitrophica bacterium]|nr:F0F1 ATP synthase subunit B [Candidatus Omnitrophota bacterium]